MTAWFSGEWVWITGAAGGLGTAMALEFHRQGARLILTDVNLQAVRDTVALHGLTGAQCFEHDVTNIARWQQLTEHLHAKGQLPRVLVNNAGIAAIGPALELPLVLWKKVIDVDLWGVIYGCHTVVPRMLDSDAQCAVLNVASAAAYFGGPLSAPYFIAKAGVLRLTQSLQGEIDPRRVRFTAFCPGAVTTGIGPASRALTPDIPRTEQFEKWQNPEGRSVTHAARKAVNGVARGRPVVNVFFESWLLEFMTRLLPHGVLARVNRRAYLRMAATPD